MRKLLLPIDVLIAPFAFVCAKFLVAVKRFGKKRLPLSMGAVLGAGMLPVRKHYYEPFVDASMLGKSLRLPRSLPGIDWNQKEQLELLQTFRFTPELQDVPLDGSGQDGKFYLRNGLFVSGDAEYLYNMIRIKKPRKVLEVGSGFSTLIAARAISRNVADDPSYSCEHTCIEPYEMPWLESTGVRVIRQRVEDQGMDLFTTLGENDILFIDSSHMIRPQGDVLFEFLEILPRLARGVIVHVHDIFSPRDYLDEWVFQDLRLWNEQYLLEAFLIGNSDWKIIGAVNLMRHNHYELLAGKCLDLRSEREPGSFYMQRRSVSAVAVEVDADA